VRPGGERARAAVAAAGVAALVLLYALPFFVEGRPLLPVHFESPVVTGVPSPPGFRRTTAMRFPGADDSPLLLHYPNAWLTARALREGTLPLWNPYAGCGVPALASGQVYPFCPFLWPFYAWPSAWAFSLGLLLVLPFAAAGAYLWMGRLGLPPAGRCFGSLLAVANPWLPALILFPNEWAGAYLGWVLFAVHLALEGPRFGWAPGAALGAAALSGHPETALFLAAAAGLYGLGLWFREEERRRPPFPAFFGRLAGSALLALLLSAPQWLPLLARLPESRAYKFEGVSANLTPGLYPLTSLFNPRTPVYVSPLLWGLLFLGLLGLAPRRRGPLLLLLAAAAQTVFWIVDLPAVVRIQTLGGFLPGTYARPVLWFALAGLAGAGAGRLWEGKRGERGPTARLLLLGALAFAGLSFADTLDGALPYLLLRPRLIGLYGAGLLLLLAGTWLGAGGAAAGLKAAGLAVVLLSPLLERDAPYAAFAASRPGLESSPAVEALRETGASPHGRVAGVVPEGAGRPAFSPNLGAVFGLRDARLLDVLQPRRLVLLEEALGAERRRLLSTFLAFPGVPDTVWARLGVERLAVPLPGGGGIAWRPVEGALPRAFVVHRIRKVTGPQGAARWAAASGPEAWRNEAAVEGWQGPSELGDPQGAGDTVEWLRDGLGEIRLSVRTEAGGLLVLLDSFARGWRATVNGGPASLYPADAAFRAVEVPPGKAEVRFVYRPLPVWAGLALGAAGLLGVAGLLLRRGGRGT